MIFKGAFLRRLLFIIVCASIYQQEYALTANSKSDPCPIFTSVDPHLFLLTNEILKIIGQRPERIRPNRLGLSISPFWQCADHGRVPRNLGCASKDCLSSGCPSDGTSNWCNTVCAELGNIDGAWNMLALLYGRLPEGITSFPPTLEEARQQLFPTVPAGSICYPELIDPLQSFGFMLFPGTYRKKGLRWEADLRLIDGFGIKVKSGIAAACLTTRGTYTCDAELACCKDNLPTDFNKDVTQYLLCKYQEIARELCLNLDNYNECYMEDVWATLWWRKPYELFENPDCPHWVIAIPFIEIGGAFATGKPKDPCRPFSIPLGNNGHNAVGMSAGVDFNFVESIEFGGEFGLTHFFSRDIDCLHVPNSPYQSGIYPWATCAKVSPGLNCHLGAKIACRHFLGCLSFFAQYMYISHQQDEIRPKDCNAAFCPSAMERFTPWKVQLANIGFNYDISYNLSLGILWQAPIAQCNAYKTSTALVSLSGIF